MANKKQILYSPHIRLQARFCATIKLRARTASFKCQVSPLLLHSLPWHRARTEPSRKVSCQSASCRATLFGGSREKRFAFRSRSLDGTEYVTVRDSLPPPARRVNASRRIYSGCPRRLVHLELGQTIRRWH